MSDAAAQPKVGHLQLPQGLNNLPAIPFWADANGNPDQKRVEETLAQLQARGRDQSAMAAYGGLTTAYTIGGQPDTSAGVFLYGAGQAPNPSDPLCLLPLDDAEQFTLPWTNYQDVYQESFYLRDAFSKTLTDKIAATQAFWPTIANFGIPYNLLLLSKINEARAAVLKAEFGAAWTAEGMDAAVAAGLAYEIDTRIIENVQPYTPSFNKKPLPKRFAPGAITLLRQDPTWKYLTPVAVKLYTKGWSTETRVYRNVDDAWIYALQAAKASITTWGIWLGHVAHWHIPTAAMQMTMYNTLPSTHQLWAFLAPMSEYLIDFDFVLLEATGFFTGISPPTPVEGPTQLLELLNLYYADGKTFFDLDPIMELKTRGISRVDFTRTEHWDMYPLAGYLLTIWGICERFVKVVVNELYTNDAAVASDSDLKAWITASQDPSQGNVKVPNITTRTLLTQLLTSLLYRVTAHAAGSLSSVTNPALAFISNFPPCLQSTDMPQPGTKVTETDLLKVMPYTGTMGTMTTFYFTFADTPPDTPAIPKGGLDVDLYWPVPGEPWDYACNAALYRYRKEICDFVDWYTKMWNAALAQIGGIPVGSVPEYANPVTQAEQWPRSIEI
jgi:hypothetical protein